MQGQLDDVGREVLVDGLDTIHEGMRTIRLEIEHLPQYRRSLNLLEQDVFRAITRFRRAFQLNHEDGGDDE